MQELEQAYDAAKVGERLRALRTRRRATLKQIATRAGVSESFLSQVERGRTGASVASLYRIALALGVSVSDLFQPDEAPRSRVLRREDRPALSFEGLRKYLLTPRPLEHLEVIVAEIEPGGSTGAESYTHGDSEELCLVLSGAIRAEIGSDMHFMFEGDSIDYRSSTPHGFANVGEEKAECVWIISPPSL